MNIANNVEFYCLSRDQHKKNNMKKKFVELKINCNFYSGIFPHDRRLYNHYNNFNKRQMSITYSHLDIIYEFYNNSDKDFCIICEDDIMINKKFKEILSDLLFDFSVMHLDILLLGYLLPYKIDSNTKNYFIKQNINNNSLYKYYKYPEYHSGTHMYMISKSFAKFIINKYYYNYFELFDKCHVIDKLFIKDGNRALIYPMIAIEDDMQKDNYHKLCHIVNVNDDYL